MIRFLSLEAMWMGINSEIMERLGRQDQSECTRGQINALNSIIQEYQKRNKIIMTVPITVPIISSVPEILSIKWATNVCAHGGGGRRYVVWSLTYVTIVWNFILFPTWQYALHLPERKNFLYKTSNLNTHIIRIAFKLPWVSVYQFKMSISTCNYQSNLHTVQK